MKKKKKTQTAPTKKPAVKKQVSKSTKKSVAEQSVADSHRMESHMNSEIDHPEGNSQFIEEEEEMDPHAVYTTFHQRQGEDDDKVMTQPLVTKDLEFDQGEIGDDVRQMMDDLHKGNAFANSFE